MLFQLAVRPYISNDSMRGRVRSNYFSVRGGIAQKATFARDVEATCNETHVRAHARTHARTYTSCARACVECGKYKKKKKRERGREEKKSTRLPRFEDRGRQWLPVSSLRGVQLSVWTMVARMNRRPPTPLCPFSSFALRELLPAMTSSPTDPSSF